ncbi:MAG: hypothetical protein FWC50_14520 [Planctomycetaceae bacterium]|nr:hypothetical protein [Planctomycetaceae bacterium]
MSFGNVSMNLAAAAAGTQMAEKQSEGPDKLDHQASAHQRAHDSLERAEKAEAAGSVRDDSAEAGDRDADGRRAWERVLKNKKNPDVNKEKSKDTSGKVGKTLDLDG